MTFHFLCVLVVSSVNGQAVENFDALALLEMAGSRELSMDSGFVVIDVQIHQETLSDEFTAMRDELGMHGSLRVHWDADRWSIEILDQAGTLLRHLKCDGSYIDTGDGHIWTHDYWTDWKTGSDDKELFSTSMWPYDVAFGAHLFQITFGRQLDYISKWSSVWVLGAETETDHESQIRLEFFYRPTGMETSFTPPETPEFVFEMVEVDSQLLPLEVLLLHDGHVTSRSTYIHGEAMLNELYVVKSCSLESTVDDSENSSLVPLWTTLLRESSPLLESSFDESMFLVEPGPDYTIHVLPAPRDYTRNRTKKNSKPTLIDIIQDYVEANPFQALAWTGGAILCAVLVRIAVAIYLANSESKRG